jgi:hypothetical protein
MPQDNKASRKASKKLLFIAGSGVFALIGTIMLIAYIMNPASMVVGGAGVFILGIGALGIWYFWKGSDDFVKTSVSTKKPKTGDANAMILREGVVRFDDIYVKEGEELPGREHRCRNDNRFYHVLLDDSKKEKPNYMPFELPDQQYYSPQVFAERVIDLPAHRRLFTRREGMGQYIKTGLLLVGMAIVGIVMIASGG